MKIPSLNWGFSYAYRLLKYSEILGSIFLTGLLITVVLLLVLMLLVGAITWFRLLDVFDVVIESSKLFS